MKRRSTIFTVAAVALTGVLAAAALAATAATINGTPKADVLKGTPKADVLNGKAGNDKLFGYGGNDTLVGGPGADTLDCGPGRDTAVYDLKDKLVKNCEVLKGPKVAISIADVSALEGNSGSTPFSFALKLSSRTPVPVAVSYATADGTATAGSDYQAASGKVTFAAGQTSAAITVSVTGDTAVEPDETFTVALSGSVNATLANASATGTIRNDDVVRAKSGHYAGTTSLGKAITFDVPGDGMSVANFSTILDMNCQEVQGFTVTEPLTLTSPIALQPDLTFNLSDSGTFSDGSTYSSVLKGSVPADGNASGFIRLDLAIPVQGFGTVHCSTGDVTWTATAS